MQHIQPPWDHGKEDLQHIQPPWDHGKRRTCSTYSLLGPWRGGGDAPYIPFLYPWWPYYPGIYSPPCLPGCTSARSWTYRLVSTAARGWWWVAKEA